MAAHSARIDPKIRAEANRLRKEVTRHNHRYYVLDDPLITDTEYEQLFRRLLALETQHPELHAPSSQTQKVGAPPLATEHLWSNHLLCRRRKSTVTRRYKHDCRMAMDGQTCRSG